MPTLRTFLAFAMPTVAGVFGILWFLVRRKPPRIKDEDSTSQKDITENSDKEILHGVKRHQIESKHGPYIDAKLAKVELQKRREQMNQQCDIDPKQAKFESDDDGSMSPIIEEEISVTESEPTLQSSCDAQNTAFDPTTVKTEWTENFIEGGDVEGMFAKLKIQDEMGKGDNLDSSLGSTDRVMQSPDSQSEFVAAYVKDIVQKAVLLDQSKEVCTEKNNCSSSCHDVEKTTHPDNTGGLADESGDISLEQNEASREVIDLSVEPEVSDLAGGDGNQVIDLTNDTYAEDITVVKSENCTNSDKFSATASDSATDCPADQKETSALTCSKSESLDNVQSRTDSVNSVSNTPSVPDFSNTPSVPDSLSQNQSVHAPVNTTTTGKETRQSQCENKSENSVITVDSNCDNTSEASNDSGKGASFTDTISPPAPSERELVEINFPSDLCGRLIGKYGRNINSIKEESGANLTLRANPYTANLQIITIDGTQSEIERALDIIQQKFPPSKHPKVDLTPIGPGISNNAILMPDIMQLNLPEGVSVDSVVSSIVDAGHVFIQQPTHPSFPSLERLNQYMLACYTQDGSVPPLPRPIESGVICAAPMLNGWYRAQVISWYEDTEECDIKYVDYGGFSRVQCGLLRQIRSDFMTLPFQAVECYMANITTLQDEEYFSNEAAAVLEELTQGKLLQAQVVGRTDDGTPYIHIYQINSNKALFVNRELVNRGVTRWVEILS